MTTRSEILDTLAASQEQVTAYFQGLSQEDLERPCTESGVPGAAPWRAKDHFAHLAQNERNIQVLLRLTLKGETSLPGGMGRDEQRRKAGRLKSAQSRLRRCSPRRQYGGTFRGCSRGTPGNTRSPCAVHG